MTLTIDQTAARRAMIDSQLRVSGINDERVLAAFGAVAREDHVPAAAHALKAGLHVYLEKPISVSVREGRMLADLVRKTGRVLQVGSQQRTMEVNRFACEFVRTGGIGRVTRVDLPNYPD